MVKLVFTGIQRLNPHDKLVLPLGGLLLSTEHVSLMEGHDSNTLRHILSTGHDSHFLLNEGLRGLLRSLLATLTLLTLAGHQLLKRRAFGGHILPRQFSSTGLLGHSLPRQRLGGLLQPLLTGV